MEKLMSELKDARLIAEDADSKSDEIAKKLQFVEEELEAAEERVKTSEAYASNCRLAVIVFACYTLHARAIVAIVSPEMICPVARSWSARTSCSSYRISSSPWRCPRRRYGASRQSRSSRSSTASRPFRFQANQRVEDFKLQLKSLKRKLKEAEKRAITAERTVKALLKEVDTKEGERSDSNVNAQSRVRLASSTRSGDSIIVVCFRRAQGGEGKVQGRLRRHGRDVRRDDGILGRLIRTV